jgi:lipopolysaccharide/colanic/teichoic acid biosynthesis glycosyltransferase
MNREALSHSLLLPQLVSSSREGPARARALLRRALLVLRLRLRDARPFLRRLFTALVAALGLIAVAPLLALAAVAIKLSSPGPVLFRQERIGKHGHRFIMLKFRTMVVAADAVKAQLVADAGQNLRFKMRRDPRVTPLGRVLRKYSIDELPQLWNVLRGDMALVGPRPPLRSEVAKYDAYALRRLEVTQGLTCLWQIAGRSDIPFEEQVKLDVKYIDRAGLADELRILAKTIPAVLSGRGAY